MMTLDEAKNIAALSDEYKRLRREKNARAVGIKKDLQDACLAVVTREQIERANNMLKIIDQAQAA